MQIASRPVNTGISRMQEAYDDDTEIVLGYGAFHKKSNFINKLIRWETFHSAMQYLSYALAGIPYMGVGRNLSYKRLCFTGTKGFSAHNHVPGSDDDLFINMAAKTQPIPGSASTRRLYPQQSSGHLETMAYPKKEDIIQPVNSIKQVTSFYWAFTLSAIFSFYPLLIASYFFYNWQYALAVFGFRLLVQGIVYYKAMSKLDERDFPALHFLRHLDVFLLYHLCPGAHYQTKNLEIIT